MMTNGTTAGRMTAEAPPGIVVFLIGMRVNRPWKLTKWLPVLAAMPRMLNELRDRPELGLLGCHTSVTGLTVLLVQYWKTSEQLNDYATAPDHAHLPNWRNFNRRIRDNGDVGVFHETYVIDRYETMYVNMPADFGLGAATAVVPTGRRGQRAAHRLDPTLPDTPVVEPY